MKKYFEYKTDPQILERLRQYYNNENISQHASKQERKARIKLDRIKKLVDFSKSDIILDVGCSRGFLLSCLAPQIKKGIGIDIAENIIEENKKKQVSNLSYYVFDGENINLREKFDKILLIDVLEHSFNPDALVKSIYEHLKDGGELILEVPFSGCLSEWLVGEYHEGHLRYYDPDYLKFYLEQFGFKIKASKTYNSVPFASLFLRFKPIWHLLNALVNLIPSKYYPYFGEIIIIAKK